jgi:hypothetical protein
MKAQVKSNTVIVGAALTNQAVAVIQTKKNQQRKPNIKQY